MKRIHTTLLASALAVVGLVALPACDFTDLDVQNPNEPTPEVLFTEAGVQRLSAGFYEAFDRGVPSNFIWNVQVYHESMGDALVMPWGNWQYRWVNQPSQITLDNGTVVTPPEGGTQPQEIQRINTRQLDTDGAIPQEWNSMYYLNNEANILIGVLDGEVLGSEGTVDFGTNAAAKEQGYRAWAHFWKGYAYARIGSMYVGGLILDVAGETNGDFVSREEIIAESNRQFDLAVGFAGGFDAIADDVVPELIASDPEAGAPTSASLAASANTMKARNLLVNTRKANMSAADWQQILSLTASGLNGSNDGAFVLKSDDTTYPNAIWFVFQAAWGPYGWHRVSERLIDDVQDGDARLGRFEFTTNADGKGISWSTRGRGIQYNSRYRVDDYYATQTATEPEVKWFFTSYEENALMRAEALIATGNPSAGADLIDEVREYQGADLDAISDNSAANVSAQLYSERRIGLFLRGLPFYDARRYGILTDNPGRTGVTVVENDNTVNTNASIYYNFLPYWPAPDVELTFNPPSGGFNPGAVN